MMKFLSSDHPHTSITDSIDRLVLSRDYDLEIELEPLVGLIKSRDDYEYTTNQQEAARALRKKLKYGSSLAQSRSLDFLDLFVSQGIRFTVLYNDDKLIERLQVIALTSGASDGKGNKYNSKIVKKCIGYLLSWLEFIQSNQLDRVSCYQSLLELGLKVKSKPRKSKRSGFMSDRADDSLFEDPLDPDRLYRIPKIDMIKEESRIKLIISDALNASTNLQNSLIILPTDKNAMDDKVITANFVKARNIRRKVLKYLQVVTEGEFLGSLIHANDQLVTSLSIYDERGWDHEVSSSDEDNMSSTNESDEETIDREGPDAAQSMASTDPFGDQNQF